MTITASSVIIVNKSALWHAMMIDTIIPPPAGAALGTPECGNLGVPRLTASGNSYFSYQVLKPDYCS
jgi:hypothetical protein